MTASLRTPEDFRAKALARLAASSFVPRSAEAEIARLFAEHVEDDDYAEAHDLLHKAAGILIEIAEGMSSPWDDAIRIVADGIAGIGAEALREQARASIEDCIRATLAAPASEVMANELARAA